MTKNRILDYADKDYLLGLLGLEKKQTFVDWLLPGAGFFGFGVLVGAGLAAVLGGRGGQIRSAMREQAKKVTNVIGGAVNRTSEAFSQSPHPAAGGI